METAAANATLQLPATIPADEEIIHHFSMGLGGPRWFGGTYYKTLSGYEWRFERGGKMTAADWPGVIARGLAGLGRFGNHAPSHYSVGRHSLLMARYLREQGYGPRVQILALLHDAPECLGAGDMNTYLKRAIGRVVRSYEEDLLAFLLTEVEVTISDADAVVVHSADKVFGESEARLLDMQNGEPWKVSEDNEILRWLMRDGLYDNTAHWPGFTQMDWLNEWTRARKELGFKM